MITIEDVKKELGKAAEKYDDQAIGGVIAAEYAAQRSVLDIPSPRPAEIDQALLKRALHNLETYDGEQPVRRIGIQGDGVRELEKPWSRRHDPRLEAESKPTTKRRTAKKATAKRAATKKGATTRKETSS